VRRGLVLGAGGVLGATWMIGALCALADEGFDVRKADLLVGTSAGSVLAALLACGVPPELLRDHQRGLPLPEGLTVTWDHETATGTWRPVRPGRPPASPQLLARAVRRQDVPLRAVLFGALPLGRGTLEALHVVLGEVADGRPWPSQLRICATDFVTGKRRVFGPEDSIPLPDAVVASCSAPVWYAPVQVDGHTYVDGGVAAVTSADLLADADLDEAYVLAPLATQHPDTPTALVERLERRWRRRTTRRVLAEIRVGSARGTRVVLLTPGSEDLQAMGANLMDPRRRIAVMESALRTVPVQLREARDEACAVRRAGEG
jgi:NTE family protein